ncbi:MAG: type II secretion system major pseudopilin GspG [Deltaproteobacteria bacterium]|nr:type II secretion system major pseudopilin GspG [Deltaproteobacteria bacterium]MBW1952538.1 type II secretion system major pseudopilin GspG [Deltaproteobacteria bacterium]MBW1986101.1 type II secretion system major pseudopilin GspG [Deltaproteobacteria bacterium]MBW2134213.1 type II secretion system major pseudopilin GspG [Deltaproteobacteria bacterium]
MTKKDRRDSGFTLIELMIVLFILGLLAALVAPRLMGRVGKAKVKTAATQMQLLGTALDLFYLDIGRYPTEEEGLQALYQRPSNLAQWSGPYLNKAVPKDPWGNDYIYKFPGEHGPYDLISLGADGSQGGEGDNQDITNWQAEETR